MDDQTMQRDLPDLEDERMMLAVKAFMRACDLAEADGAVDEPAIADRLIAAYRSGERQPDRLVEAALGQPTHRT